MDDGFEAFYRETCRRLIRFAYGLTGDSGEAQELVQEAYARAWQRRNRLAGYDDAEAWLRLVVTRLATDRWRRLGVRRRAAALARPPAPVDPPAEDTVLLVRALRLVPLAQRRALVLHYLLDRSVADIATETGASLGTVKSWLSRGRTALAQLLTDPHPAGSTWSPAPGRPEVTVRADGAADSDPEAELLSSPGSGTDVGPGPGPRRRRGSGARPQSASPADGGHCA